MKCALNVIWVMLFGHLAFGQAISLNLPLDYNAQEEKPLFLVKDDRGFVLIATTNGIHTHYGSRTKFLPTQNRPTAILAREGKIYMGDAAGHLTVFSVSGKMTARFSLADSSSISALHLSGKTIFAGSEGEGLFKISLGDTTTERIGLTDPFVHDISEREGAILVATDRGIDLVDPEANEPIGHINSGITMSLSVFRDGFVTNEFGKGLVLYSSSVKNGKPIFGKKTAKIEAKDGKLYVLTPEGIVEYDNTGKWRNIYAVENIADFTLTRDMGLAILGEDGTLRYADLLFSKVYHSDNEPITALAGNEENLFIGHGGKVSLMPVSSGLSERTIELKGHPDIVNFASSRHKLFSGTFDQGIFEVDLRTLTVTEINVSNGLKDNSVLGMTMMDDTLWFSTLSGLANLSLAGGIHYFPPHEVLGSTYIYDLHSRGKTLYIGTDGSGLLVKTGTQIEPLIADETMMNSVVYRIVPNGLGGISFITKEQGIHRWDALKKKVHKLLGKDELGAFAAFGAGPYESTLIIDERKLTIVAGSERLSFTPDPVKGSLFGTYLNTIAEPFGNKVFFGFGHNIYALEMPDHLPKPEPRLLSVTSNLRPVENSRPRLDHDANNIIFQLGSPWYRSAESLEFRYRLKGLEEGFRTTRNPELVYPNLPYGEYVLEASAGLDGSFYGDPEILLEFEIKKPFYLEIWFIISSLMLTALLIYTIISVRVSNINRLRLAEKKLVESELAVLRTQVNPHFLFNSFNTLLGMIEPYTKQGAEYLEKLSDFYRRILEENKNQTVSLSEELHILEEYNFLQIQRFGEGFSVEIKVLEDKLDRLIPCLTLQLLAENAIKHNVAIKSDPLILTISTRGEYLYVSNVPKPKRNKSKGTGTGLENIRSRYLSLFGKTIEIEHSEKEFCVKLPMIEPMTYAPAHS